MRGIKSQSNFDYGQTAADGCSAFQSQRRNADPKLRARSLLLAATVSTLALAIAMPASAQISAQKSGTGIEEVIVTARKRQETLLNVPIVTQAITGPQLAGLKLPTDIESIVPSLTIGEAVLSSGTRVFLRGVGTTSGDPGVDQSISLNVDGLQLTNGLAYTSGLFDLGRIEVLKGPQGLFYGKNSPGGVISLYSADPTDRFEVTGGAGYEVEARTKQTDLIVSGPASESMKLRLAARYANSDGFFKNAATALPGTGALTPADRFNKTETWIVRGTALWAPASDFDARLKVNYVKDADLWVGSQQYVSCPDGVAPPPGRLQYLAPADNCRQDRTAYFVGMDPAAFPGVPSLGVPNLAHGGAPYRDSTQWYGTLEMNYHPTTDLTVTSLSGYYYLHTASVLNSGNAGYAGTPIVTEQGLRRRDITEELRVNSSFTGPINFTTGAFYQDAYVFNLSTQRGNITQGQAALRGLGTHRLQINTYSLFGQLRWQVFDRFELAGGARWSNETRKDRPNNLITGIPVPVPLPVPRVHSDNVKPEFTATYRPTDDLTLFASYKTGYKSGSLNISTGATPGVDRAYNNEYVKGGEIGLKSRLLDRRLAVDLAAYDYRYSGLQVTVLTPGAGNLPVTKTLNAGAARTYGLELNSAYNPPTLEDLTLKLTLNWNRAHFQKFDDVQCIGGQTIAQGCNELLSPVTHLYTAQNLSGLPLLDAPEWSGSFGFDYERPVGGDMSLAITNNNHFSSSFLTALGTRSDFYQGSFIKADLGVALKGPNDRWEISLSGQDLNNALTRSTCANSNAAGGLIFGGEVTGGTTSGPAGVDELVCYIEPGRAVWLTVTFKPFN